MRARVGRATLVVGHAALNQLFSGRKNLLVLGEVGHRSNCLHDNLAGNLLLADEYALAFDKKILLHSRQGIIPQTLRDLAVDPAIFHAEIATFLSTSIETSNPRRRVNAANPNFLHSLEHSFAGWEKPPQRNY